MLTSNISYDIINTEREVNNMKNTFIVNGSTREGKQLRKKYKAYDESVVIDKAFEDGYHYVRSVREYNEYTNEWITKKV